VFLSRIKARGGQKCFLGPPVQQAFQNMPKYTLTGMITREEAERKNYLTNPLIKALTFRGLCQLVC